MRTIRNHRSIIAVLVAVIFITNCVDLKQKVLDDKIIYESLAPIDSLENIWELEKTGSITWNVNGRAHTDHLEFSGLQVSGIITYGTDEQGEMILKKSVVWPMLRLIPNNTHASLIHRFDEKTNPSILINGEKVSSEKPYRVKYDGLLSISSTTDIGVEISRVLFPSTTEPVILEILTIKNTLEQEIEVIVDKLAYQFKTPKEKGVYGVYTIQAFNTNDLKQRLQPDEEAFLTIVYSAHKKGELKAVNGVEERKKREDFIQSLNESLILETPDPVINQMFQFAKIRATESIFATKGGLMHGPGGGRYYAAIWANDQAEYVNPFFPFLGNKNGNESAINSFRHFARFMNPDYYPIPSSIIAEGVDIWNGAGDRGDAAMIAYGASRFALAYGDKKTADSLLPLIKWCFEYCERKMLPEGVIASDCDELENRFPAGEANLSTNMLAYGGYISTANLLRVMDRDKNEIEEYERKAMKLRQDCEDYFGGNVQGFNTYKYFKENVKLRSWICLPLVMGINDRKTETLKALFSPNLWNKNGIYTETGDSTFWDRATLYAFRGIFFAGETDIGMKYFKYYSQKRLLGEHVPYAVEAYPEGNQRHLSAESGLYCRAITEGLFGIEPTGFNKFNCSPQLPGHWDYMKLLHIKAFKQDFDLMAEKIDNKTLVKIISQGKIIEEKIWDGKDKIEFILPSE